MKTEHMCLFECSYICVFHSARASFNPVHPADLFHLEWCIHCKHKSLGVVSRTQAQIMTAWVGISGRKQEKTAEFTNPTHERPLAAASKNCRASF